MKRSVDPPKGWGRWIIRMKRSVDPPKRSDTVMDGWVGVWSIPLPDAQGVCGPTARVHQCVQRPLSHRPRGRASAWGPGGGWGWVDGAFIRQSDPSPNTKLENPSISKNSLRRILDRDTIARLRGLLGLNPLWGLTGCGVWGGVRRSFLLSGGFDPGQMRSNCDAKYIH